MVRALSGVSLAVITLLGTVVSANAQGAPTVEVGVGYAQFEEFNQSLPGLYGSVGWRLTRWLSVVGEVSWHARHEVFDDRFVGNDFFSDDELTTILGGARFIQWSSERIAPFGLCQRL